MTERTLTPKQEFNPDWQMKYAVSSRLSEVQAAFDSGKLGDAINKLQEVAEFILLQGCEEVAP